MYVIPLTNQNLLNYKNRQLILISDIDIFFKVDDPKNSLRWIYFLRAIPDIQPES